MKKQINKSVQHKVKTILFLSVITIFLFSPVINKLHAQQSPDADIYVNYVGNAGGQPVFFVKFKNSNQAFENLQVSNKEGQILYKEKIKGKLFIKRFQVDIPAEEPVELILSFSDKEGKQIQKYVVSSNMLMVRNVEVTKL